jgi:hypothetical protein
MRAIYFFIQFTNGGCIGNKPCKEKIVFSIQVEPVLFAGKMNAVMEGVVVQV